MNIKQWINNVPPETDPYWDRVEQTAKDLNSDGCTDVMDFYVDSCYEHDIHWRTGETIDGLKISKSQANTRFRKVIQSRSKLGKFSPLSWIRYSAVSIVSWFK